MKNRQRLADFEVGRRVLPSGLLEPRSIYVVSFGSGLGAGAFGKGRSVGGLCWFLSLMSLPDPVEGQSKD